MSIQHQWVRVNKNHPCPICKKNDWCTVCPDLGLALCMRVQSDRPSKNKMGGWLHSLDGKKVFYVPRPEPRPVAPPIDFEALWKKWQELTSPKAIIQFADSLGVEAQALQLLGAAWSAIHDAWAFPMWDSLGVVVGIRLRTESGDKFAVRGSHVGTFQARPPFSSSLLYVLEGPTDTAAALGLNLHSIGRPSCMGCEEDVTEYIEQHKIRRCVIVADNDTPGLRGAERLQATLTVPSCILVPPCKDMREFVRLGGDNETLMSMQKSLCWTQP